ncbi:MAG: hypothetical protein AAGH83_04425 [Pseudomonadota bacterium]
MDTLADPVETFDLTTGEPLEIASEDDGPRDAADYLIAYFHQAFATAEPVPDALLDLATSWLRRLTHEITPPPPELTEAAWAYFDRNATAVDGVAPEPIKDAILSQILPALDPADFDPLDPETVDHVISKIVLSRDPRNLLEKLLLLLKADQKLRSFVRPGGISVFRRDGPFQVDAVTDVMLLASMPLARLVQPSGAYRPINLFRPIRLPATTDVLTYSATAWAVLLSDGRIRGSLGDLAPDPGVSLKNLQRGGNFVPATFHLGDTWNPLRRGPTTRITARVVNPFFLSEENRRTHWITVALEIKVTQLSAIIDLDS